MENLGIVFGIIFWPVTIFVWFVFLKRRFRKTVQLVGSVLILALPVLGGLAMAHDVFLDEPLIGASQAGDVPRMERLLFLGASANAETNEEASALSFAAGYEHVEAVRVFLEHHANPNVRNAFSHRMILAEAEERGDKEVVRLLRQYGASERD